MKFRKDLILREIGGEYIIIDPGQDMVDMSKVFTFNETAAFIWREMQDKEVSIASMTELLLASYDAEESEAIKDAEYLMNLFIEFDLLVD